MIATKEDKERKGNDLQWTQSHITESIQRTVLDIFRAEPDFLPKTGVF
jgi:hypothetical protein